MHYSTDVAGLTLCPSFATFGIWHTTFAV